MSCVSCDHNRNVGVEIGYERHAAAAMSLAINHICDLLDLYPHLFAWGDENGGWLVDKFHSTLRGRGYDTTPERISSERKAIPRAVKEQLLDIYEHQCRVCGSRNLLQIDHIVPVSKGGSDEMSNLQILCKSCNISKGNKDMHVWMASR